MPDPTESIRRKMVVTINTLADITTESGLDHRALLEREYGADNVWDTQQLSARFEVLGFMAPFCIVRDRKTGAKGSVMFQHSPRFYFSYQEDK